MPRSVSNAVSVNSHSWCIPVTEFTTAVQAHGSDSPKAEIQAGHTSTLSQPASLHEKVGASTEEDEDPESPLGSLGSKRPESPLAPGDAKRMRRIEANREAARQTIRRKRAQHDSMLHEEKDLEQENAALRKEIHNARQEVEGITTNISFLKAVLKAAEEKRQRVAKQRSGDHRSSKVRLVDNIPLSESDRALQQNMGWHHQGRRFEDNDSETSREMVEAGAQDHPHMRRGPTSSCSRDDYQGVCLSPLDWMSKAILFASLDFSLPHLTCGRMPPQRCHQQVTGRMDPSGQTKFLTRFRPGDQEYCHMVLVSDPAWVKAHMVTSTLVRKGFLGHCHLEYPRRAYPLMSRFRHGVQVGPQVQILGQCSVSPRGSLVALRFPTCLRK